MKHNAKYFFLLPGVVWVLLFTLFPLIYSLYLSTTNFRMGREPQFVGFENYAEILGLDGEGGDEKAAQTAGFSAFIMVGSTILTIVLGTFIAWIFNHDLPFLKQMRAIITMPLFAAPVAVGFLGVVIFNETNGPINNILQGIGLGRVNWIIDPNPARWAILLTDVWQWTPFVFIVVLAAMQGIPDDLFESAKLDTKSSWVLFSRITLPMIAPALGTVLLLRLVETIKMLDIPTTLTRGGPGSVTQTYTFYIREVGLRGSFQLGDASALSYLVVIVAIIISSIYFWRMRARYE
ncbi:MAG: sugar ABC transporter permease [Chloroflexota bacterium]|nr:sugar ABC transporter permease [Chloroflexota bacterium]